MNNEMLAEKVGHTLASRDLMMTAAESCTGGGVAYAVTSVPGSSAWFERGFVTYTNQSKREMLGVARQTLMAHGAVSEATVAEMAAGALRKSDAQLSLAISGIAGPGGATAGKPVGMVCFAWAYGEDVPHTEVKYFQGDRRAVREQSIAYGLQGVLRILGV